VSVGWPILVAVTEVTPRTRRTSWPDVKAWLAASVQEHSVLVSGLTIGLAWVGSVVGVARSESDGPNAFLIGGVVALGLAVAVLELLNAWAKRQADEAQRGAAARLGVAVKDALRPVAELVAQMPLASAEERERLLYQVSQQATAGLYLLFEVDGVRAVVYRLDEAGEVLSHLAYHGRGDTPGGFERRSSPPDPAFEALVQNRTRVVHDTAEEDGGGASDRGYRTYIAVPVVTGETPYGMLTVDAPEPRSFTETDVAVAEFTAELLAVAFAEAAR
jgi:hypothetical protein